MPGPYKQQLAGSAGNDSPCPACPPNSQLITLCYSSVSANDLCCGSPVQRSVYIANGFTWETAPGYYQDNTLTTPAANGWYSGDAVENPCGGGPGPITQSYSAITCNGNNPIVIDGGQDCNGDPLPLSHQGLSTGDSLLVAAVGGCSPLICAEIVGVTFAAASHAMNSNFGPFAGCNNCSVP